MPPTFPKGRQPGPAASQIRTQLHRLCRVPTEDGLPRVRIGSVPPQAQPLGQFRHTAGQDQPALQRLPTRLQQAANCGVREPEHVSRHARLLDPHRRPLDEKAPRPIRALGATAQQPAHRHLRRECRRDGPLNSNDHRRCERAPGCLSRATQPLQAAPHYRGHLWTARTRARQSRFPAVDDLEEFADSAKPSPQPVNDLRTVSCHVNSCAKRQRPSASPSGSSAWTRASRR